MEGSIDTSRQKKSSSPSPPMALVRIEPRKARGQELVQTGPYYVRNTWKNKLNSDT